MMRKLLRRIQCNHALEHATINLVSRRYPDAQLIGLSGPMGFTLYTSLTAEEIVPAARQALRALQTGRRELAVHKHCGTNMVVTALLTTIATLIGLGQCLPGSQRQTRSLRDTVEQMPRAVLLNTLALMIAPTLGHWLQANVTTNPDLSGVEIASIFTDYQGGMGRIRVHTRQHAATGVHLPAGP